MKTMLDDAGLAVCCIASPFFKCDIASPTEIARHHDILRRCGEIAHVFGINLVRGFTFWRKGPYEKARILDLYQPVVKICEEEDIVIGIENEASTFIGTGHRLADFLALQRPLRCRRARSPLPRRLRGHQAPHRPHPHQGHEAQRAWRTGMLRRGRGRH